MDSRQQLTAIDSSNANVNANAEPRVPFHQLSDHRQNKIMRNQNARAKRDAALTAEYSDPDERKKEERKRKRRKQAERKADVRSKQEQADQEAAARAVDDAFDRVYQEAKNACSPTKEQLLEAARMDTEKTAAIKTIVKSHRVLLQRILRQGQLHNDDMDEWQSNLNNLTQLNLPFSDVEGALMMPRDVFIPLQYTASEPRPFAQALETDLQALQSHPHLQPGLRALYGCLSAIVLDVQESDLHHRFHPGLRAVHSGLQTLQSNIRNSGLQPPAQPMHHAADHHVDDHDVAADHLADLLVTRPDTRPEPGSTAPQPGSTGPRNGFAAPQLAELPVVSVPEPAIPIFPNATNATSKPPADIIVPDSDNDDKDDGEEDDDEDMTASDNDHLNVRTDHVGPEQDNSNAA